MPKHKHTYALGQCGKCGQNSSFHISDYSFDYEYGSIRSTHKDKRWESDCCEAAPQGEVDYADEPDYDPCDI